MGAIRIYPGLVVRLRTEFSLDWQFKSKFMRLGLVIPP
ncbi:hypothetical protein F383_18131 [Gossypium arboreum]|uniref:Uncharacterized protein n=1 Tax=Gossypium arboreum TaxID=29729 RepID=A0A0B0MH93_GOSAR|nr:hypothetical protein F383_18131 [Gossypium arboreum]